MLRTLDSAAASSSLIQKGTSSTLHWALSFLVVVSGLIALCTHLTDPWVYSNDSNGPIHSVFAKNYLRPVDDAVLQRHGAAFPRLNTFRVETAFGSWAEAQKKHFADGGVFDRIYTQR